LLKTITICLLWTIIYLLVVNYYFIFFHLLAGCKPITLFASIYLLAVHQLLYLLPFTCWL
jgi:hypothetical protein